MMSRRPTRQVARGRALSPICKEHGRACHDSLSRTRINAAAKARFRPDGVISWDRMPARGNVIMSDALLRPIAEIAVLLGEGRLKARDLVEAAIANHERFGGKLMAYSQWAPAR